MKTRVLVICILSLAFSASVNAQKFVALLDGLQENAPVVTTGTGMGMAVYDAVEDELHVTMSYSGLVAPTTDSHIHCCATSLGTNAGVAIGFTGAGGFITGSTSGSYSHTFDMSLASTYNGTYFAASGGTPALARDRLLAAMTSGVANDPLPGDSAIAYFNIHTSFRPGGEIRGNIIPFVPEPSAVILLIAALAPAAFVRRER
jgi:hypothetical protein